MALEAMKMKLTTKSDRMSADPNYYILRDVDFLKALLMPDPADTKIEIHLSLTPSSAGNRRNSTGWEEFRICSWSEETGWNQNCHGYIMAIYPNANDDIEVHQERDLQETLETEEYFMMKNASKMHLGSKKFYEELEASGNKYGKTFATLRDIQVGNAEAVGRVTISDHIDGIPTKAMHPHIIHPATLDALFHSSFPISLRDGLAGSIMIVGIKEFIFCANTSNHPGHSLSVGASVSCENARSSTARILALEQDQKLNLRPVISLSAELRAIGETRTAPINTQTHATKVYEMKWDRDIDFITDDQFLSMSNTSPSELGGFSQEDKRTVLSQAACIYIHDCLRGVAHKKQEISVPHLRHFYNWIETFSTSEGYKINLERRSSASLQRLETWGVEGELLQRVGNQLEGLLTTQIDPLACLLQDGLLQRFYADDESLTRCYGHLIKFLELAIFKNPQMSILEVGAGTGGTTLSIFKALTNAGSLPFNQYDYTDISFGFFGDAKDKLQDWAEMLTFKTLNIEEDPIRQGFEEASYDMVIASNVIHATERIGESLDRVHKLLKPGGKLALIEVTQFDPSVNLIFGTLSGWWRGKLTPEFLISAAETKKSCRPSRRANSFSDSFCFTMEQNPCRKELYWRRNCSQRFRRARPEIFNDDFDGP